MEKYEYHYYIVYMSESKGWGACNIDRSAQIRTSKDIYDVADYISHKWCDDRPVIVLNYIEMA